MSFSVNTPLMTEAVANSGGANGKQNFNFLTTLSRYIGRNLDFSSLWKLKQSIKKSQWNQHKWSFCLGRDARMIVVKER